MLIYDEHIQICLEVASHFRLRGCAFDPRTRAFPEPLAITNANGKVVTITPKRLFSDPGMQASGGLFADEELSFDLQLFDLFNETPQDVKITWKNEHEIWSLLESLKSDVSQIGKSPKIEIGRRQLIVLSKLGDPLRACVDRLHEWQPNMMVKPYTSGISMAFMDMETLREHEDEILPHAESIVLLTHEQTYPLVMREEPWLASSAALVLVGETLKTDGWLGGFANVLSSFVGPVADAPLSPHLLYMLLSHLVGYTELFFDTHSHADLYLYQSGDVFSGVDEFVREQVQEKMTHDIVVMSKDRLVDLRQAKGGDICIVVNQRKLSCLMDIFGKDPYTFLKEAYQRGLKPQNIVI